mgnify:CR=1 FL=1
MRADFNIMKNVSEHTIIPPHVRKASLENFINICYNNSDIQAELKRWNIEFKRELLNFPARVLNPETIYFRNKKFLEDERSGFFFLFGY